MIVTNGTLPYGQASSGASALESCNCSIRIQRRLLSAHLHHWRLVRKAGPVVLFLDEPTSVLVVEM